MEEDYNVREWDTEVKSATHKEQGREEKLKTERTESKKWTITKPNVCAHSRAARTESCGSVLLAHVSRVFSTRVYNT